MAILRNGLDRVDADADADATPQPITHANVRGPDYATTPTLAAEASTNESQPQLEFQLQHPASGPDALAGWAAPYSSIGGVLALPMSLRDPVVVSTDTTRRLALVFTATVTSLELLKAIAPRESDLLVDVDAMTASDEPDSPDPQPLPEWGYFSISHRAVFAGVIVEQRADRLIIEQSGPTLLGSIDDLISDFESIPECERVLLSTATGIGYPLAGQPVLIATSGATQFEFATRAPEAREKDTKQRVIFPGDGGPVLVLGPESVFDAFMARMQTQEGEWVFDPAFGSRCGKFLRTRSLSKFIEAMLTLEAIRLAYEGPEQANFVSKIHGIALVGTCQNNEQRIAVDIEFVGYPRIQRIVTLSTAEQTTERLPIAREIVEWEFSSDDGDRSV